MNAMNLLPNNSELNVILFISQDAEMADLLKVLFEQRNYKFVSEASSKSGYASARLLSPSLIILDLNLPNAKLLDLCRDLRGTTNGTLLMLHSNYRIPDSSEFHFAGVDETITVPISPMALMVKSLSWLARQNWLIPRRQSMEIYL